MTAPVCEYAGKDLPQRIQRAIARCMDPAFPVKLNAPERVALATLLRRVEAEDGTASFWVKRCNLADLFDRVERTVSNWLQALEDAGLIQKEQGRTRWGNFSCVTVRLSSAASILLGLSEPQSSDGPKKTSAGHKKALNQNSLYERHLAETAGTSSSEFRSKGVPEDCAPLLTIGMSSSAVFKLMKVATAHGKRLGPIVAARFDAIRLSSHRFAYLRKLASDGIDYAALRKQEIERSEKVKKEEAEKQLATDTLSAYENAWIEPRPGIRFFLRKDSPPDKYELRDGSWKLIGAVIGEHLLKLLERIEQERPARLAMSV